MHCGCRVSSIALTIVTLVAAAAAMSPEELIVRSTYAKAKVAFEIEQMSSALYGDRDKFAKTEHLQIEVSSNQAQWIRSGRYRGYGGYSSRW